MSPLQRGHMGGQMKFRIRPSTDDLIEAVLQPSDGFGYTLPPLPVAFSYAFRNFGSAVLVTGTEFLQTTTVVPITRKKKITIDPFKLREAFLRVESQQTLVAFLEICGPFRDYKLPQNISWSEFLGWQRYLRSLLIGGPASPPALINPHESLANVKEQPLLDFKQHKVNGKTHPYVEIACYSALEIIGASIFLDRYRSAQFVHCALTDCPGLVEKGIRDYCNETCGATAKKRRQRSKRTTNAKAAK